MRNTQFIDSVKTSFKNVCGFGKTKPQTPQDNKKTDEQKRDENPINNDHHKSNKE